MVIDIAIIMTCYNRKELTIQCLTGILNQKLCEEVEFHFYICDDGSSDGTVPAIRTIIPEADIYVGDGNLFWARGMFQAMCMAVKRTHDYYLMMNDDLEIREECIQIMIDSYRQAGTVCGIVGSTFGLTNNTITYGGYRYKGKCKDSGLIYVESSGCLQKCDVANWNCFMISQQVLNEVGLIDAYYEHGLGDFDYCCMMKKHNIPVYVATQYIGRTDRNPKANTYADRSLPKNLRIKKLLSKKGRPIKSELHFYWKNHGGMGIIYFGYYYAKILLSIAIRPRAKSI